VQLEAETNVPLTEVYISETDRYRIYQAPEGKRNWAASPAPVIKKNGVQITSGFTIDYGGGAIILSPSATATDVFTADVYRTKTDGNKLATHLADNVTQKTVHGLLIQKGTWAPVFKGSVTPGNTIYVYNAGKYTKIDNVVIIQARIAVATKDTAMAGELYIDGLPFVCAANYPAGIAIARFIKFDMPTGFDVLTGKIIQGTGNIYLFAGGDNQTSSSAVDVSALQNGSTLDFSATYLTD
jgi:hypothetical protein